MTEQTECKYCNFLKDNTAFHKSRLLEKSPMCKKCVSEYDKKRSLKNLANPKKESAFEKSKREHRELLEKYPVKERLSYCENIISFDHNGIQYGFH